MERKRYRPGTAALREIRGCKTRVIVRRNKAPRLRVVKRVSQTVIRVSGVRSEFAPRTCQTCQQARAHAQAAAEQVAAAEQAAPAVDDNKATAEKAAEPDDDNCVICLDKKLPHERVAMECMHWLCRKCLSGWFARNLANHKPAACPICRHPIKDARALLM